MPTNGRSARSPETSDTIRAISLQMQLRLERSKCSYDWNDVGDAPRVYIMCFVT